MNPTPHLRFTLVALSVLFASATQCAVTVEAADSTVRPAPAQIPRQSRSVNPSTAETPQNEKRPLGTAIGGVNSATPMTRQGDSQLSMKCWQDGKLIIDQPIKALPADAQKSATMASATTGNAVYAFDFKNAMCVVK